MHRRLPPAPCIIRRLAVACILRRHAAVAGLPPLPCSSSSWLQRRRRCSSVRTKYRRKHEASEDMPLDADVFAVPPGPNAPQQVHITLGDQSGTAMTVSWVTVEAEGSNTVLYGRAMGELDLAAEGTTTRYDYYNYTSGPGTSTTARSRAWSTSPSTTTPWGWATRTLTHYEQHPGDAVLFVGDLSYADKHPFHDNNRWDTWGRFAERSVAYQPWIWTTGNHEIDYAPELGELASFKPFTHRYPTPYRWSDSLKMGPAHIIVLASYTSFGKYTPQIKWLEQELTTRVNRTQMP
ncbi:hypothetical protein U9M48_037663 [Paspalum notatum var. saurae]|uniref:Purple acid phosphatase n=1 Tax=Paspalum notatum var. saurae TaxID=547442 RepID=A0AAQ3UG22_PASNO